LLKHVKIDKGDRMNLKYGDVNHLTVNRKTDIGYMLDSSDGEVFLHFNESLHRDLKPGEAVEAFLYFDQKGRLAATLKTPYITVDRPGFLKVSDVNETLGVFLDMGISKELLLSIDDLPRQRDHWPQVGDTLYVSIRVKGKLVAKLVAKEEIELKPENELNLKDHVDAYIQKIGKEGLNLITPSGHLIFVHHSMYKEPIRYGELRNVKVTFISEKGYSGSLIEQKEVLLFDDANKVLSHIVRYGDLDLTADSTPEEISHVFDMSKKAFKRALGTLYRERKIDFVDGKTILVKKES
jgi:predicted RNA-binding protein (virulence factor B family)